MSSDTGDGPGSHNRIARYAVRCRSSSLPIHRYLIDTAAWPLKADIELCLIC